MVRFQFFKKGKLELKNICQTRLSASFSDNSPRSYEFSKNEKIGRKKENGLISVLQENGMTTR